MVPLGMELAVNTNHPCICYRLAAICDATFDWWVANLQFGRRHGHMGSEMGPLSSPGTTSYRLSIVTIGLSLTVFAVLRMFQTDERTDGRNWSIKRRHYALKCIDRKKTNMSGSVYSPAGSRDTISNFAANSTV